MKRMHESEYTSLKKRLDYLKRIRRVEIAEVLRFATELGDLRENAEYDAATHDYERVEREIYLLEKEIQDAIIINSTDNDIVMIGSKIALEIDGEVENYIIRNSSSFDFNSISAESVIGKNILGHKAGDTVLVDSLDGKYTVKIISIS